MFAFSAIFLLLIALLWLALLLSPVHAWTHRHPLNSTTKIDVREGDWPRVTMVIPARNEAAWLPITVPTYCEQDYPDIRVILVDDQSEDDSPKLLDVLQSRYKNLTVLKGSTRPEGWCGKPWTVQQGVNWAFQSEEKTPHPNPPPMSTWGEGTGWLLFTDADCLFHPKTVMQAMRLARSGDYDAVSLLAHMTFGSRFEEIALTGLATVLNLILPMGLSNHPKSSIALAAGGFILVKRSTYEKIGGHEAVKGQMIEDVMMGRKLKLSGAKLHTRATADLVSTRMYDGFADLWEGLSKNAYAGMDYDPKKFWVGLVMAIAVAVLPPAYFVWTLLAAWRNHSYRAWLLFGVAAVIVLCQSLIHLRTVRHMKLPLWHCLLMPASAALYAAIVCNSAWQHHYAGGNVWAGRRYDRAMLLEGTRDLTEE